MAGHKIKLLRETKEDEKLAPQQKVIYDAMLKVGVGKEIDRENFVKDLEKSKLLTTRQSTDRVVSYYLQDFTKRGIAESIKPPAAPKPEKPAKTGEPSKPGTKSVADGDKKPEKAAA